MNSVMITGCSSGFGLETARFFFEKGWHVIATMRKPDNSLFPTSDRLSILELDVTDQNSIDRAVREAGPIDVLINNAGIGYMSPFENTSDEIVHKLFDTNTFGTFNMVRAVVPQMRGRKAGTIINLSSSTTLKPLTFMSTYTASKAAVTAYTECLALELAPLGIRTVLIIPGLSPSTSFGKNAGDKISKSGEPADEYKALMEKVQSEFQREMLVQELTKPEDVVNAIWQAVTDSNCPVCLPAGPDAVALSQ
ncbi:SDR family oxidoreductase [Microbulbifer spongiae]|uniref:SDR family oxidoreductase n=1 Tax=Microbulbifer spongiae TaxID=2944933 RepID=A0ABY9EAN4_9GAMM|nr:SDR family oxidoreductase [Microbulbifer sp. MI-G]WKD50070.1 SDR family oxidoreductase [Microbulbifer sp. MI-G]